MEKQFAERSARKPAGGVSILPERNDEVQKLTVRPWTMKYNEVFILVKFR